MINIYLGGIQKSLFLRSVKFVSMSKKEQDQNPEVLENIEVTLNTAEQFLEKNYKQLLMGLAAVVVLLGGYYAYQEWYKAPIEEEAQVALFRAQKYFENDSLEQALNGDPMNIGFLQIADDYSGTKAGNLANYYAGVSYLNRGEFENAITYLDKFSSNDGILNVIAKGAIGDAFIELNQPNEALDYYKEAASMDGNSFVTPVYLKRAAQTSEILNDYKGALKFYQELKDKFPKAPEAIEIDKNIAFCESKSAE